MTDDKGRGINDSLRKAAVPGMRRKDGSYVAAVVPPEWEAYFNP